MSEMQNAWVIRVLKVDPSTFGSAGGAVPPEGTGKSGGSSVAGETESSLDGAAADRAARDVPASAAGAVAYAKGRLAWLAMRTKVDSEFENFLDSVAAQYEDEGNDKVVRDLLRARLAPVMNTFDDTLADTLDDAANETDPDRRQKLVSDARGIIEQYQAYVANEPLLEDIDNNPFAPTAIRKTMVETLQTLSATLR